VSVVVVVGESVRATAKLLSGSGAMVAGVWIADHVVAGECVTYSVWRRWW
jgi:hypothetical protein